jgi:hypothetical protein
MIAGSITLHYITCNLKNVRLQITFDYMKNVIDYNRLRLQITITQGVAILMIGPKLFVIDKSGLEGGREGGSE